MNFEELENTWDRQLVVGQPVSAVTIQHTLVREVQRRRRRVQRIIGVAAFLFLTGWAVALVTHYTGIKPFTPLNLGYLTAITCFDLVFFFLAFRSLQRMSREEARMGESLVDAVHGSLRAVDWQIRDCRRLAYGVAFALIASLAFASWKYITGEFPAHGLMITIVMDLALAVGLAWTVRRYYLCNLKPRRDELDHQLHELEA